MEIVSVATGQVIWQKMTDVRLMSVIIAVRITAVNVTRTVVNLLKDGWSITIFVVNNFCRENRKIYLQYNNCRYHVPRSFINDDVNELVLFEEFGGNPTLVNFQTIRVGTACGIAYENKEMELSCQGRPISAIKFASFGDVQGACGSYENGSCTGRNDALSIVQNACVGKESCTVTGSESIFGAANCADGISKKLIVEARC